MEVNVTKGIVWLASYPKSGNTWVRAFLAAYLTDGEPLRFHRLEAVTGSDSRWSDFTAVSGKPPHELSDAEVDALRPAVQRRLAAAPRPMQVVKTHNARMNAEGQSLAWAEHTRAAIYVVRNPLDIVDSLSDHAGQSLEATIALLNDARHSLDRDALVTPQYVGTWSGHVTSWTEQRLARAIAASSFGALRRLEDRGIFPETSGLARSGRFFRRGKPDFWHNVLSRRQTATVLQQHGEVMARLGYVLPDLREIFDS
ncbi:MAG: hypothetical protein B7Z73_12500 [Planctomycetia bacterium 21-64-5]|nr:MAG: hypothetical protein B7Z73_12500 [Planctomycetia bacterium 21-64-5]